jgi:hypothetical protein
MDELRISTGIARWSSNFTPPTSPHTATSAAHAIPNPPNNLGLVVYWSFNDGTSTKATDFSGNGNTGTLSTLGSVLPTWVNGKRGKAIVLTGWKAT